MSCVCTYVSASVCLCLHACVYDVYVCVCLCINSTDVFSDVYQHLLYYVSVFVCSQCKCMVCVCVSWWCGACVNTVCVCVCLPCVCLFRVYLCTEKLLCVPDVAN